MNIEYKNEQGEFPVFYSRVKGKNVAVMYDVNTKPFAEGMKRKLASYVNRLTDVYFPDEELVPDEAACRKALEGAKRADYLLAVERYAQRYCQVRHHPCKNRMRRACHGGEHGRIFVQGRGVDDGRI